MTKIENQCVGCPKNMGCLGSSCPNRNVEVVYCDICGCVIYGNDIYDVKGQDVCEDCLKDIFYKGNKK